MKLSNNKDIPYKKQAQTKRQEIKHSSKLISLLIVLVSLVIILVTSINAAKSIIDDHAKAVDRRMQINSNVALSVEQQIINVLQKANRITAFVGYLYSHSEHSLEVQNWIRRHLIIDKDYIFINVINDNGKIVADSGFELLENFKQQPLFNELKENPYTKVKIDLPVYEETLKRWVLPIYKRIENDQGEFNGVVVLAIDPATIGDFFKDMNLSTSFVELSGIDGMVRTRMKGEKLILDTDKTNYSWISQYLYKPAGSYVDNGKNIDDIVRIMSFRGIDGYDLVLTMGTSYKDAVAMANARKNEQIYMTIIINLLVLLFAAALIYLVRRQDKAVLATQANEALFRATFHHAAMGIVRVSEDGTILECNNKFQRMLGYTEAELENKNIIDLLDVDYKDKARKFLQDRLTEYFLGMPPEIEQVYKHKNGSKIWVHEALSVVRKANGMPDFLVSAIQDITERKNLEEKLSYAASHDLLTDLPNRTFLQRKLVSAINAAEKSGNTLGMLFLDLNGFKNINDTYGHSVGDELLKQVAKRLENSVRIGAGDLVARYGGDEFSILLSNFKNTESCSLVAHKIANIIAKPFDLGVGKEIKVTASIGAAFYPCCGNSIDELMSHADFAMYYAKNNGLIYATWPNAENDMHQIKAVPD